MIGHDIAGAVETEITVPGILGQTAGSVHDDAGHHSPLKWNQDLPDHHGKHHDAEGMQGSKFQAVMLPMMHPAAAAGKSAVARPSANTRGTNAHGHGTELVVGHGRIMEIPTVDFKKPGKAPDEHKGDDHPHQLGQEMDTRPPQWIRWGGKSGNEKFSEPKGSGRSGRQNGCQPDGDHDDRDDGLPDEAS